MIAPLTDALDLMTWILQAMTIVTAAALVYFLLPVLLLPFARWYFNVVRRDAVKHSIALLAALVLASTSQAFNGRGVFPNIGRHQPQPMQVAQPTYRPAPVSVASVQPTRSLTGTVSDAVINSETINEALAEVNAKRASRGLRPFVYDDGLTRGAQAVAAFRAQHHLFGHTGNDFSFLPSGVSAQSAGCAAYPPSYGWMSCDVYDNFTYGGAAWVMGSDGKRYMHLFVR